MYSVIFLNTDYFCTDLCYFLVMSSRTYVLSRLIKCLRCKSLISCQRYSCSSANSSNQDPTSDPDKLTELLNKAERSTTEDKNFSDNSQDSVNKTNDDSKSDVVPSSISNFQENSSKKVYSV